MGRPDVREARRGLEQPIAQRRLKALSFYRVHSKARSTKVAIEGLYGGCSGFLIGGGASLLGIDGRMLKMPGVISVAINNAALVYEPDIMVALDSVETISWSLLSDARIMKMLNYNRAFEEVDGKRLCHYPNTLFFDLLGVDDITMAEFCSPHGPLPFWRNTFFTALAAMYQLGFKKVYLLGCTFDASQPYAHQREISAKARDHNAARYAEMVEHLKKLLPLVNDEGFEVFNCHQGGEIEDVCPYVPYEEAVGDIVSQATSTTFNNFRHAVDVRVRGPR